jgi:DNA-binding MarR family transcriptional regulator
MSVSRSIRSFENEEFLLYRLANAARRVSTLCADVYESEFSLSVPEWRLLAQIGRFGSISATEVRERTSMERVAISRAAARCLANGLIVEKTSNHDKRSKVLSFTAKGRNLYRSVVPRSEALAREIEAGLSRSEARDLKRLLGKLEAHARGIAARAAPASDIRAPATRRP